jgi:hypothetical protein
MDDYSWDIPPSTIKSNREWKKKIHSGYWCACYDVKRASETIMMVHKASRDPGMLAVEIMRSPPLYLVSPEGNRVDN